MKSTAIVFALLLATLSSLQAQPATDAPSVVERAKAATVLVLAGEGNGRVTTIAVGTIVSKDGTILTAYHAIKGASEVQVRLSNGEIFDRVALTGFDERRDIASLKIAASALPLLTIREEPPVAQGEIVYAITNADGLVWSATDGVLSAIGMADQIPGAGSGFRLLQFTAPVAADASGGALVDGNGKLLGIIGGGKGKPLFAVPIEAVLGLPNSGRSVVQLGLGNALQLPSQLTPTAPLPGSAVAAAAPKQLLVTAKTIVIHSKTAFVTVDSLARALMAQKDWDKIGLTIVSDQRLADLTVDIDHTVFTYAHTFLIADKKTTAILGSGKVTAFDGSSVAAGMAKEICNIFSAARLTPTSGAPKK